MSGLLREQPKDMRVRFRKVPALFPIEIYDENGKQYLVKTTSYHWKSWSVYHWSDFWVLTFPKAGENFHVADFATLSDVRAVIERWESIFAFRPGYVLNWLSDFGRHPQWGETFIALLEWRDFVNNTGIVFW